MVLMPSSLDFDGVLGASICAFEEVAALADETICYQLSGTTVSILSEAIPECPCGLTHLCHRIGVLPTDDTADISHEGGGIMSTSTNDGGSRRLDSGIVLTVLSAANAEISSSLREAYSQTRNALKC